MTTTSVAIDIVCPDWCQVPMEDHVVDLWDLEGNCAHQMGTLVEDTTGHRGALQEPRMHEPIAITLGTLARHSDGREVESPSIYINGGSECSLQQALDLAERLKRLVADYRAAGGVE